MTLSPSCAPFSPLQPKLQQLLGLSWVSGGSANKWCDYQSGRGTPPPPHHLSQMPLKSRYHSGPVGVSVQKEILVIASEVGIRDASTLIKILGSLSASLGFPDTQD